MKQTINHDLYFSVVGAYFMGAYFINHDIYFSVVGAFVVANFSE